MSAPIVAEVRDGTLWVEVVAKDDAKHAVSLTPPFDFETIKVACGFLHETLAGVPEWEIS